MGWGGTDHVELCPRGVDDGGCGGHVDCFVRFFCWCMFAMFSPLVSVSKESRDQILQSTRMRGGNSPLLSLSSSREVKRETEAGSSAPLYTRVSPTITERKDWTAATNVALPLTDPPTRTPPFARSSACVERAPAVPYPRRQTSQC